MKALSSPIKDRLTRRLIACINEDRSTRLCDIYDSLVSQWGRVYCCILRSPCHRYPQQRTTQKLVLNCLRTTQLFSASIFRRFMGSVTRLGCCLDCECALTSSRVAMCTSAVKQRGGGWGWIKQKKEWGGSASEWLESKYAAVPLRSPHPSGVFNWLEYFKGRVDEHPCLSAQFACFSCDNFVPVGNFFVVVLSYYELIGTQNVK